MWSTLGFVGFLIAIFYYVSAYVSKKKGEVPQPNYPITEQDINGYFNARIIEGMFYQIIGYMFALPAVVSFFIPTSFINTGYGNYLLSTQSSQLDLFSSFLYFAYNLSQVPITLKIVVILTGMFLIWYGHSYNKSYYAKKSAELKKYNFVDSSILATPNNLRPGPYGRFDPTAVKYLAKLSPAGKDLATFYIGILLVFLVIGLLLKYFK